MPRITHEFYVYFMKMKYKITVIRELKAEDEKGVEREYILIRFRIDNRVWGSVQLLKKGFTAEKGKKAVEKYVKELKPLLEVM